jgi:hypothetical protein
VGVLNCKSFLNELLKMVYAIKIENRGQKTEGRKPIIGNLCLLSSEFSK